MATPSAAETGATLRSVPPTRHWYQAATISAKPAAVKLTAIPRWQAARPSPRATRVLPVPLLPTAMTFSRRWMYAQRASSITSALFTEGIVREVEGVQALDGGEAGGVDPALHHALVAVDEFQFGQAQQVLGVVHDPRRRTGRPSCRMP